MQENSGPGNGAKWGARAALVVIFICAAILFANAIGGVSMENVLPFLGLMILGPVFTWFLVFSLGKTIERGETAKAQADAPLQGTAPDTVVFDIGNVLTEYSWQDWLASAGYSPEMTDRIARASVLSSAWNEFDRGELPVSDIIEAFVRNDPEIETEIRDVFSRSFHGLVSKRDRAIPWIRELKAAGYRVLYLSNFSDIARRDCADALEFIPLTDGGIMSYEDRVIKPEEAIYRLLLTRFQVTPERAVFLDDKPENIEAARALHMNAILFESQSQAEEDLRGMGVEY